MAVIIIPLRSDIFQYTFTKELEGVVYKFTIGYNLRTNSWKFDIGNEIKGLRLCGGVNLLKPFYHLNVPPGELRIIDLDNNNSDPNKTNLGDCRPSAVGRR